MGKAAAVPAAVMERIQALRLLPHPEGGYFREIHRGEQRVIPADGRGARAALTVIWFLLPEAAVSRWHRVRSDEVWTHLEGAPLELLQLAPGTTTLERIQLGPAAAQQVPLHTVPAGRWQAARSLGPYTLVSCVVAPGFEFADFELLSDHPGEAGAICQAIPEAVGFV